MRLLQNQILQNKGKKPILYDALFRNNLIKKPIVVFCHGYKGFKDWGAWGLVGEEFLKNNYFFVKFNFSHNGGTMANPIDFPDLQSFGNNNFSHELDDLDRVIDHLKTCPDFKQDLDSDNISLIGHSRGGGSVLIKASEDKRIKRVITWAGVSDFKTRFNEGSKEFEIWKKKGVIYVENTRTKQSMPHFFQFYKDFKKNESRFDIKAAVERLEIPHLIIHGTKDSSVLPFEAENLFSWNKKNQIKRIEGSDHVFSSKHPWESNNLSKELKEVVDISIDFLRNN